MENCWKCENAITDPPGMRGGRSQHQRRFFIGSAARWRWAVPRGGIFGGIALARFDSTGRDDGRPAPANSFVLIAASCTCFSRLKVSTALPVPAYIFTDHR